MELFFEEVLEKKSEQIGQFYSYKWYDHRIEKIRLTLYYFKVNRIYIIVKWIKPILQQLNILQFE